MDREKFFTARNIEWSPTVGTHPEVQDHRGSSEGKIIHENKGINGLQ